MSFYLPFPPEVQLEYASTQSTMNPQLSFKEITIQWILVILADLCSSSVFLWPGVFVLLWKTILVIMESHEPLIYKI